MSAHLTYRPDIDGLRAIAVTSVISYHAFPRLLTGGFIGVDVFFVISGYLITGILVREQSVHGRVNFAEFYARRVRRLLPPLFAMVVATALAGLVLVPPIGDLQALGNSAAAALLFSSNFYFDGQGSGYFATAAEIFPLLHTWTLAVEEQFYIGWPAVLLLVRWAAKRGGWSQRLAMTVAFATIFAVSLLASTWATSRYPSHAFYLMPFRAWEFAIGGLLCPWLRCDTAYTRLAALIGVAGLALIAFAVTAFDESTPFPGAAALAPTLGAAALIAAGALAPANLISRQLARRGLVYVGAISYGWYLWHWPSLALLRTATMGDAGTISTLLAVLFSLAVSTASYRWLEQPVRSCRWRPFATARAALLTGAALLVAGVAASLMLSRYGDHRLAASPRLQAIAEAIAASGDPLPSGCASFEARFKGLKPVDQCLIGATKARPLIMLIGDSHASRMTALLDLWGRAHGMAVLPSFRGGCRPLWGGSTPIGVGATQERIAGCAAFRDAVVARARELSVTRPITLLLVARWPDRNVPETVAASPSTVDADMRASLTRWVAISAQIGARLVLAKDTPYMPHDVPRCLAAYPSDACGIDAVRNAREHDDANRAINTLVRSGAARAIDPAAAICDVYYCHAERFGAILYSDAGHLTYSGARRLADSLAPQLDAALLR